MSWAIRIASSSMFFPLSAVVFAAFAGCASESLDATSGDGGRTDALIADATANDARADAAEDAGAADLGPRDSGEHMDAEPPDLGIVRFDAGAFDAGEESRSWQAPLLVETRDQESAEFPALAVSENDDVFVAWVQMDFDTGQPTDVWAARAQGGGTFSPAEIIDNGREAAARPVIAADAAGRAVVAWAQGIGGVILVRAARFEPGTGWGNALPVYGTYPSPAPASISVAIDPMGRATVAWEDETAGNAIWVSRYENMMWSDAVRIDSAAIAASRPRLAASVTGEVFAVWTETATVGSARETDVVVRRYNPVSMIWAPPDHLDTLQSEASAPELALDGAGNAVVVWTQNDGVRSSAFSAYSPVGGGWEPPIPIENDGGGDVEPTTLKLGAGARGDAFAVWRRTGAPSDNGLWGARAPAGLSWEPQELLEDGFDATPKMVAVDRFGHALSVWESSAGTVHGKRNFAGVWSASAPLTGGGENAAHANVGAGGSGNGVAVWSERPILQILASIWSSRFQ